MTQLTLQTPLLSSAPVATQGAVKLLAVPQTTVITPNGDCCGVHTAASANGGTGALCAKWNKHNYGPRRWLEYNKTVHPPQETDEEPRKAVSLTLSIHFHCISQYTHILFTYLQYVCHMRSNIKYSPDKMWYIAAFVRGMSVDEALKQLNFVLKKGATDVRETILEAQQMAIERHNVEYRSNLWIGKSSHEYSCLLNGLLSCTFFSFTSSRILCGERTRL